MPCGVLERACVSEGSAPGSVDSRSWELLGHVCGDGQCFIFDGGEFAEAPLPAAAIGALDPGDDRDTQFVAGTPASAVEHVLL